MSFRATFKYPFYVNLLKMGKDSKTKVFEQKVKHKGFFSYSDFYAFCYNWWKDKNYKVAEEEYTEKVSSFGKEVLIKWVASKKESDYFKFASTIKWHILGLQDAEVERDGKSEKTNKGEVKIAIKSEVESDYAEEWSVNPFWKFLRGIYDKYIVKTTADTFEKKLKEDSEDFVEEMKAFLTLEGRR